MKKPHYCCFVCGFVPIEGSEEYVRIHGYKKGGARCILCNGPFPGSEATAHRYHKNPSKYDKLWSRYK